MKRTIIFLSFILLLFSCSGPEEPQLEINTDGPVMIGIRDRDVTVKGRTAQSDMEVKVALEPLVSQWLKYSITYLEKGEFELTFSADVNQGLRPRRTMVSLFVENSKEVKTLAIEQAVEYR